MYIINTCAATIKCFRTDGFVSSIRTLVVVIVAHVIVVVSEQVLLQGVHSLLL